MRENTTQECNDRFIIYYLQVALASVVTHHILSMHAQPNEATPTIAKGDC